jgi:hypothetical protein
MNTPLTLTSSFKHQEALTHTRKAAIRVGHSTYNLCSQLLSSSSMPPRPAMPHERTIAEAVHIAFVICYYIASVVLTLALLIAEVTLVHVILHRVYHGRFSALRAPTTSASDATATEQTRSLLETDNDPAVPHPPPSADSTTTQSSPLPLLITFNAWILFVIPFMMMLMNWSGSDSQKTKGVPDFGVMGSDFLFGMIPGSIVLAVLTVVEIVGLKLSNALRATPAYVDGREKKT